MTMPGGELELEYYLDYRAPDWGDKSTANWSHQIELEYGITDHWDLALYQVFSQPNSGSYRYSEMKFRTRYRLFEAGLFVADPLLYLELKRPSNSSDPNIFEGKFILAKEVRNFNLAGNFILERELISGAEWEKEYAVGSNYQIIPAVKAGVEVTGNFNSGSENHTLGGPTFSFASERFFITAGALWGTNDQSDDFRFRYIIGLEL